MLQPPDGGEGWGWGGGLADGRRGSLLALGYFLREVHRMKAEAITLPSSKSLVG